MPLSTELSYFPVCLTDSRGILIPEWIQDDDGTVDRGRSKVNWGLSSSLCGTRRGTVGCVNDKIRRNVWESRSLFKDINIFSTKIFNQGMRSLEDRIGY